MFLHPSIHLELARQRHQDLLAAAERRRIVKASDDHKEAIHAFYHPFAVARGALYDEAEIA